MKLSDIMSNAGLSGYAEIALILFLLAFVAVVALLFHPARRDTFERARMMPLDDEHPQTPRPREE